ncbi:MAG TPA: ribonuclease T2 [Mesorhizobium sp.]|nr:ribonuclease T2 [Mesorhizobium sp.]
MPGAALTPSRLSRALLLALLLAAGCEPAPDARNETGSVEAETGFDFYVLALSWSPSFCAAEGADANPQQCESGKPYAFIVHGLWPQFERGYPENCPIGQRDVPREIMRGLYDLMPSAALIRHQWRKHGSCSSLDQDEYFATLRKARERVQIPAPFRRLDAARKIAPAEVEQAFLSANPGLPADGVAVTCDGRLLREVRICLTKALAFRACPEVDRRACRARNTLMPPMHGG